MVTSLTGLRPENYGAGENQQQLQTTEPSSRQRERPKSTNTQLSDSNKNLAVSPRRTDRPTDRRLDSEYVGLNAGTARV
jgi:hypothetical protein